MKEISTKEKSKTKSNSNDGPSQRTLNYLMLLARLSDVESRNKQEHPTVRFDVCLN